MLMLNYDYRNSPTIKFCADLFPAYSTDVLPLYSLK